MLKNLNKRMHLPFNCPLHSPFGFVRLMHQTLSACALFCLNSLTKANMQLLIYKYLNIFSHDILFLSTPLIFAYSLQGWRRQVDTI